MSEFSDLMGTAMRDADEAAELRLCTLSALGLSRQATLGDIVRVLLEHNWCASFFLQGDVYMAFVSAFTPPSSSGCSPERAWIATSSLGPEDALLKACSDLLNRCCLVTGLENFPMAGRCLNQ